MRGGLEISITGVKHATVAIVNFASKPCENQKRAEYGFGEYGFKHRTQ